MPRYPLVLIILSITLNLFITQLISAQITQSMKAGQYYLEGVREVGSGFHFNSNKTFDFFFSYGAIDRVSTGTWEQKGDSIILNNARKPATDFLLTVSKNLAKKRVTILVYDPNPRILGYVYCSIEMPEGTLEAKSDKNGMITFDIASVKSIKSITLVHGLWPDHPSVFEISQPDHNYFEFTIGRWIADVEFKDLALQIRGKNLSGAHPLMEGNEFRYVLE
jgi:hypothetical protein